MDIESTKDSSERSIKANLIGLLDYAKDLSQVKNKTITDYMVDAKVQQRHLGDDFTALGNVSVNTSPDAEYWFRIERVETNPPPRVPDICAPFLKDIKLDAVNKPPVLNLGGAIRCSIDEASDLMEAGLVREDAYTYLGEVAQRKHPHDINVFLQLEDWPHAQLTFNDWVFDAWGLWAEHQRAVLAQINVYQTFFKYQQELKHAEELELVLGQNFTSVRTSDATVRAPLLEHSLEIFIDEDDGYSVKVAPRDKGIRLVTSPFLTANLPGSGKLGELLAAVRDEHEKTEDAPPLPFSEQFTERIGLQTCNLLTPSGRFDSSLTKPASPEDKLLGTAAWMLMIKPKSLDPYVAGIDELKKQINQTPLSALPEVGVDFSQKAPSVCLVNDDDLIDLTRTGASRFASGGSAVINAGWSPTFKEGAPSYYFPLPANDEQKSIMDGLEANSAVSVCGPPGTGKSHTIANIIAHSIATGKTVLVTAKTAEALAGVKSKLPDGLAKLCIALLNNDNQARQQVEKAISYIASEVQSLNRKQAISTLTQLEVDIERKKASSRDIEMALFNSAVRHLAQINFQGNPLTPMMLVKHLKQEVLEADWLNDKLTLDPTHEPQFTTADIEKLRQLRVALGQDIVYAKANLPELKDLPDVPHVKQAHESLRLGASIQISLSNGELPEPAESLPNFENRIRDALASTKRLNLFKTHVQKHSQFGPLLLKLLDKATVVEEKAEILNLFAQAVSWLDEVSKLRVHAINVDEFDWKSIQLYQGLTRATRGEPAFGIGQIFQSVAKKEFEKIRFQGLTPSKPEQFKLIVALIDLLLVFEPLKARINALSAYFNFPQAPSAFVECIQFLETHETFLRINNEVFMHWEAALVELQVLYPWGVDFYGVKALQSEFDNLLNAMEAYTRQAELARHKYLPERLIELCKQDNLPSATPLHKKLLAFARQLGSSVGSAELGESWRSIRDELSRINTFEASFKEVGELAGKIYFSGAPIWANRLVTEPVSAGEPDALTPSDWQKYWDYARADGFVSTLPSRAQLLGLGESLHDHFVDIERLSMQAIELRALIGLHQRMSQPVAQALNEFKSAFARIGQVATGIRSRLFLRQAQSAMERCFSAIPCWIVPEGRVAEQIPAVLKSFDLVVVDESSQSDLTALPVILRGNKLLVVGDDKQVSPSMVGVQESYIARLMETHLSNHPHKMNFHPTTSLYDLVSIMSPAKRVMLKEHFRCVEPIISFCSKNFYPEPLIALRQPKEHERMDPPLVDIYVKNGVKDRDINRQEAEVIVQEIMDLVKDPAMSDKSIGVVSLIGNKQASIIQNRLIEALGIELISKHKLECGDARYFQGQERDVIFLSMVASPGQATALTGKDAQQRFNVAVSRARDRLVLVRSVGTQDLRNPDDMKFKLLEHFLQPAVTVQSDRQLIELCESGFEREVFTLLVNDGFKVIPQFKVGPYRIDLVVEGLSDARLAVELDGDSFHGPDKFASDKARQTRLERVGWRFWRCWASDWYTNTEACYEELLNMLERMNIRPVGTLGEASTNGGVAPSVHLVLSKVVGDEPELASPIETLQLEAEKIVEGDVTVSGLTESAQLAGIGTPDLANQEQADLFHLGDEEVVQPGDLVAMRKANDEAAIVFNIEAKLGQGGSLAELCVDRSCGETVELDGHLYEILAIIEPIENP